MRAPAIRVERHASPLGRWEMARREPPPQLRGIVLSYVGWEERTPGPLRRRERAIDAIPVVISFGPAYRLRDVRGEEAGPARRHVSFVAGLADGCSIVEHDGVSRGVELLLTPLGARRVLGLPLAEIANQVVELEDLLGAPVARELVERLATAPDWAARFALLDRVLAARLAHAEEPAPAVAWAWRRLAQSGGRLPVGALAQELGCSRRHLVVQVREQLGLPPKTLARVLRFNRAVGLLERDDGGRLAEIALDCGYWDQAHLNRDFRAFAGEPPSAFLARRLPDGGGYAG